ncbi:MAG: acetylornithine deacetylase/succinyl-diaminopimelate desuccinylase-like protein [Akkermansiaceae bacterium]|jgi:acetylornithine deacetylase/succinyl-diaminopimelate desuccinylase-like protein
MPSVVELLQALVQIPSVNPEGDPGVSPGGEEKVAQFVAKFLDELGFDLVLQEIEPGRPNLIARAPGPTGRPRILLGPHLDTVGIVGMTIAPFTAEISDGKIHGRGTSDTKGPMAAMLWGLRANAHRLASLPVAVDFVGFMGEESSQPGSRHFAKHHASEYQFAIAGEPTSLKAVYCTKGCLWATVQATGRATHASQPHLGENAILKLMDGIRNLHGPFRERLAQSHHAVLGQSTLNVGLISGGSRANIVPALATAQIDIRTVPSLVKEKSAADLLREFVGGLELVHTAESPPMSMSPDHPWLLRLKQLIPDLTLTGAPWFSDAAHLSAGGLPSICLGPGSIDQAHTADEFISISDLEAGAQWFTRMISGLAD